MLSHEDNELLCRIGAAAPMGRMVRRYWVPALMSEELESDGAPKRVRLLGEDLIAFRDSAGRVGLLEEFCPHRRASLALGRNEACGLRCLYHGWKFDVSGRVMDMPTEPTEHSYKDRVRAPAYPVRESGGLVWAYMGPSEAAPPPMDFAFATVPDAHRVVVKMLIECNWVQCLEGVIDSAHANYLHADTFKPVGGRAQSTYRGGSLTVERPSGDGRPRLEVEDTAYGFRYAAIRRPLVDADRNAYIRVTLFVAPFYSLFAGQAGWGAWQAFVPVDDRHTMLYFIRHRLDGPVDAEERQRQIDWSGLRMGIDIDGDYRKMRRRDNDWLQDRTEMQQGRSFSGLSGVQIEDAVIQESMGPLCDRSKEHLGTSDIAVIRMRRLMLQSVRRFTEQGTPPLGLGASVDYPALRAEEGMVPLGTPWQSAAVLGGSVAPAAVAG